MNSIIYFLMESSFYIYYYLSKSETFSYLKILYYVIIYILFQLFNIIFENKYIDMVKYGPSYLLIESLFGKLFHINEVFSILLLSFSDIILNIFK